MPKITAATVAVTAFLLAALTGCADGAGKGADETSSPSAIETAMPEEPEAPLAAGAPQKVEAAQVEAEFIEVVRDRLSKIQSQIPDATDEQLVSAAWKACEQMNNTNNEELSLIEGETKTSGYYMDSDAIKIAARLTLCPIDS